MSGEPNGTVSGSDEPTRTPPATVLRVVGGHASHDELAALVAVVGAKAASSGAAGNGGQRRSGGSGWTDHARRLRVGLTTGPDAWRRSAWPS